MMGFIDSLGTLLDSATAKTLDEVRNQIDYLNQQVRLLEHYEAVLQRKFPEHTEEILARKPSSSSPIISERIRKRMLDHLSRTGSIHVSKLYRDLHLTEADRMIAAKEIDDNPCFRRSSPRYVELTGKSEVANGMLATNGEAK